MDFNNERVISICKSVSLADKSMGYFVDIPSGRQGIRELLAHEASMEQLLILLTAMATVQLLIREKMMQMLSQGKFIHDDF